MVRCLYCFCSWLLLLLSQSQSSTPLSGGGWQLWGGLELPHTLPSPLRGGGRVWLIHQIHPIHQNHQYITLLLHTSSLLLSYHLSCYSSSPFIPHTSLLPTHLSTPPLYKTHLFFPHTSPHLDKLHQKCFLKSQIF